MSLGLGPLPVLRHCRTNWLMGFPVPTLRLSIKLFAEFSDLIESNC